MHAYIVGINKDFVTYRCIYTTSGVVGNFMFPVKSTGTGTGTGTHIRWVYDSDNDDDNDDDDDDDDDDVTP
jgi:hypothetical protein